MNVASYYLFLITMKNVVMSYEHSQQRKIPKKRVDFKIFRSVMKNTDKSLLHVPEEYFFCCYKCFHYVMQRDDDVATVVPRIFHCCNKLARRNLLDSFQMVV